MKNVLKSITCILLLSIILLNLFTPYVHAGIGDIWGDAQNFLSLGNANKHDSSSSNPAIQALSTIVYSLGVIIAISATIILGIQYMIASSSESKSNVKKKAITVVIGVLLLFASGTIWQLVVGTLSSST